MYVLHPQGRCRLGAHGKYAQLRMMGTGAGGLTVFVVINNRRLGGLVTVMPLPVGALCLLVL